MKTKGEEEICLWLTCTTFADVWPLVDIPGSCCLCKPLTDTITCQLQPSFILVGSRFNLPLVTHRSVADSWPLENIPGSFCLGKLLMHLPLCHMSVNSILHTHRHVGSIACLKKFVINLINFLWSGATRLLLAASCVNAPEVMLDFRGIKISAIK